jgi:glucose-6-phosphate dehydrogenase assembly protein OpcA
MLADKVILDTEAGSGALADVSALGAIRNARPVADLAWTRLTRWRETIAQMFECPAARARHREITEIRIAYGGKRIPPRALYLGGWLAPCAGRRRIATCISNAFRTRREDSWE